MKDKIIFFIWLAIITIWLALTTVGLRQHEQNILSLQEMDWKIVVLIERIVERL